MDEKQFETAAPGTAQASRYSTTSTAEDEGHDSSLPPPAGSGGQPDAAKAFEAGEPDIDHEDIEAVVPGHQLDLELEKVSKKQASRASKPSTSFSGFQNTSKLFEPDDADSPPQRPMISRT